MLDDLQPENALRRDEMIEHESGVAKNDKLSVRDGKTRIRIWVDTDIFEAFKTQADIEGRGYQTAMNEALRVAMEQNKL